MDPVTRSSVSAIVEYDYSAKEPDELDLVKGAIIKNIKVQPGGWWEGTLASNGKTGMFPDNFVRLIEEDDKSPVVLRDKSATINRRCKVVYSYTQHNDDELSLVVGNIIEVLGEVEEGWWRGKLGDKIGVFPSNFVVPIESSPILNNRRPDSIKKENRSSIHSSREDLLSSSPSNLEKDAPLLPPKPVREYCRVQYPYDPQNEDELELRVGDLITIISKELPDKGWWKGELRGKVGVFPDNFVTILPAVVSPSKDSSHGERHQTGSSKVFIKKSGSGSSSQSSTRKDSFGSRDSLNDILNETGIVSGNVAAQRKSLENKNIDLTVHNDIKTRRSLESKTSDVRKSMESIDEKKTPPPVLSKKPQVPVKKQTTVTSVAGNLLSGLKQKVKSVEHKLSAHDSLDGIGSSKLHSYIADNNDKNLVGEKFKKEDSDFDTVERGSMLQDMRASRAKAPKRRPPTQPASVIGESNNNNSIYLNGTGAYTEVTNNESRIEPPPAEPEELAKPKPREWEKRKAPWMEELKASQARKTSPSVEPRASDRKSESETTIQQTATTKAVAQERSEITSKTSSSSSSSQQRKSSESTVEIKISGYEQTVKKESSSEMTKSMSAITAKMTATTASDASSSSTAAIAATSAPSAPTTTSTTTTAAAAATMSNVDDIKMRPTSLSIRNRSVSPPIINRKSSTTSATTTSTTNAVTAPEPSTATVTATKLTNCVAPPPVNSENVCSRVTELEQRVQKLEALVESQSIIINELVRSLQEENDKVKGLKTELEKYAQCVTQV